MLIVAPQDINEWEKICSIFFIYPLGIFHVYSENFQNGKKRSRKVVMTQISTKIISQRFDSTQLALSTFILLILNPSICIVEHKYSTNGKEKAHVQMKIFKMSMTIKNTENKYQQNAHSTFYLNFKNSQSITLDCRTYRKF